MLSLVEAFIGFFSRLIIGANTRQKWRVKLDKENERASLIRGWLDFSLPDIPPKAALVDLT